MWGFYTLFPFNITPVSAKRWMVMVMIRLMMMMMMMMMMMTTTAMTIVTVISSAYAFIIATNQIS